MSLNNNCLSGPPKHRSMYSLSVPSFVFNNVQLHLNCPLIWVSHLKSCIYSVKALQKIGVSTLQCRISLAIKFWDQTKAVFDNSIQQLNLMDSDFSMFRRV
ncbi:unnamed protein product [Coffea canephora]|uniref:Uncharacterized protein n=1 Tax=Coffea canephora TaxID=49390 RepID=A0A068V2R3_COFCA|nr:unnamed protein product [Coffea canephora]